MKKLLCDICGGPLEMKAGGKGAACAGCGMTYSVERLKEMLQMPAQEVLDIPDSAIEQICDVAEYEPVEDAPRFMLIVEDCFQIKNRGMVVTGTVQNASIHLNEQIALVRMDGTKLKATVGGIERSHKLYDRADPSEGVGILLPEIRPGQVAAGDVICAYPAVGQSVSDYYTTLYCTGCGVPFRVNRQVKEIHSQCPNCNTPLHFSL